MLDLGSRGRLHRAGRGAAQSGEEGEITLPWPGSEVPLKARCRVAWWHPPGEQAGQSSPCRPGPGLQFVEMSDVDRERLREHLEDYCRQPSPGAALPASLARGGASGRRSMKRWGTRPGPRGLSPARRPDGARGRPLHERAARGRRLRARGRRAGRHPLRARHHGPRGGRRASTPTATRVARRHDARPGGGRARPTRTRTACAR